MFVLVLSCLIVAPCSHARPQPMKTIILRALASPPTRGVYSQFAQKLMSFRKCVVFCARVSAAENCTRQCTRCYIRWNASTNP